MCVLGSMDISARKVIHHGNGYIILNNKEDISINRVCFLKSKKDELFDLKYFRFF